MVLHTYRDTFGSGRARGRGRGRGRRGDDAEQGRGRGRKGRGRGQGPSEPSEPQWKAFSGSAALLLDGDNGADAHAAQHYDNAANEGVFAQEGRPATMQDSVDRQQQRLEEAATVLFLDRQEAQQAEAGRHAADRAALAAELASRPPALQPSQMEAQAAADHAATLEAAQGPHSGFDSNGLEDLPPAARAAELWARLNRHNSAQDAAGASADVAASDPLSSCYPSQHHRNSSSSGAAAGAHVDHGKTQQRATGSTDVIDLCNSGDENEASPPPEKPPLKKVAIAAQQWWGFGLSEAANGGNSGGRGAAASAANGNSNIGSSGASSGLNPFLHPEGAYAPTAAAPSEADLRLHTREYAEVADLALEWHYASAILDTGNEGCTLMSRLLAQRLGFLDAFGKPTQARTRYMTVHGVVAGASERLPTMAITYRIKGKIVKSVVGVSDARLGCDLLISRREILDFERDGYRLSAQL